MNHFFDIGANVGQTFDDFLCPTNIYDGWTIWCFEPSPRHHAGLIERARKERDRFEIKICPFGLSNGSHIIRFFEKDDPRGDSFDEKTKDTNNLANGYEIIAPVFGICDFISHMTTSEDNIHIKIDAEGAEYLILDDLAQDHHSSQRARVKQLWVEFHDCDSANKTGGSDAFNERFKLLGLPIEKWMF